MPATATQAAQFATRERDDLGYVTSRTASAVTAAEKPCGPFGTEDGFIVARHTWGRGITASAVFGPDEEQAARDYARTLPRYTDERIGLARIGRSPRGPWIVGMADPDMAPARPGNRPRVYGGYNNTRNTLVCDACGGTIAPAVFDENGRVTRPGDYAAGFSGGVGNVFDGTAPAYCREDAPTGR